MLPFSSSSSSLLALAASLLLASQARAGEVAQAGFSGSSGPAVACPMMPMPMTGEGGAGSQQQQDISSGRIPPECLEQMLQRGSRQQQPQTIVPAPVPTPSLASGPAFPTPPRTEGEVPAAPVLVPGAVPTPQGGLPRRPRVPEYTCYDCHKLYLTVIGDRATRELARRLGRARGREGEREQVREGPERDEAEGGRTMETRLGAQGSRVCPGLDVGPGVGAGAGARAGAGSGMGLGLGAGLGAGAGMSLADRCRPCLADRTRWRELVPGPYLRALADFHAQAGRLGRDLPACQQRAAALVRAQVPACGLGSYRDAYNALYWSYEDQLARAPTCEAQAIIRMQMRAIREQERAAQAQALPMGGAAGPFGVAGSMGPGMDVPAAAVMMA